MRMPISTKFFLMKCQFPPIFKNPTLNNTDKRLFEVAY